MSDPTVTVIVSNFVGPYNQQVRIIGEAVTPKAIPFQAHMTVLDAMISAGGLTPFAAGNRAKIVRKINGKEVDTTVRLADLLKSGDRRQTPETRNMTAAGVDVIVTHLGTTVGGNIGAYPPTRPHSTTPSIEPNR